jgi:hypothetical protein
MGYPANEIWNPLELRPTQLGKHPDTRELFIETTPLRSTGNNGKHPAFDDQDDNNGKHPAFDETMENIPENTTRTNNFSRRRRH